MPLSYTSPRPARGLLAISGDDRQSFLQGLISNDVRKAAADQAIYAALLTPQGKFLHDFFLVEDGDSLLLETEGERLTDLRKRLSMYKLRSKVGIEDRSDRHRILLAFGDGVAAALGLDHSGQAVPFAGGIAFADPRLDALGARLILPAGAPVADLETLGFTAAPFEDYDRLRLSLGVPDGSRDMQIDKAILLESGFDELHGVDWQKGCYMGQELTARTKYRGLVKKRLMPVRIEGALPEPGTLVTANGKDVGEIRSGTGDLALALLRLESVAEGAELTAGTARVVPAKPGWATY
jgi:folate-binding protein YgfZ